MHFTMHWNRPILSDPQIIRWTLSDPQTQSVEIKNNSLFLKNTCKELSDLFKTLHDGSFVQLAQEVEHEIISELQVRAPR